MRKNAILYSFIIMYAVIHGSWIISQNETSAAQILLSYSFGRFEINPQAVVDLTLAMFPYIIFQVIEGIDIYSNFCIAGVYVFSRCPNRRKWLIKEFVKLFGQCVLYSVCWFIPGLLLGLFTGRMIFEHGFWCCFFGQVFIMAFWLFWTTSLSNLLALFLGSYKGIGIVLFIQFTLIGSLLMWSDGGIFSLSPECIDRAGHLLLLKLNPVSQLILCFHSIHYEKIMLYINIFSFDFSIIYSAAYLLILSLIVVTASELLINYVDFLKIDRNK